MRIFQRLGVPFELKVPALLRSLDRKQQMKSESTRLAGSSVPDHQGLRAICSLGQMSLLSTMCYPSAFETLPVREFGLVKSSSFSVNSSRGERSTRTRWCECQRGKIRGAALDIYNWEHLPEDGKRRTIDEGEKGSSGSFSIHI